MDLEKLATSAIEKEIAKTDLLSSFINSGDREPCWDGHIYIHEDKKKTKKNIKKVAAQVKGYDKAPNPELLNAARQMNVWLGQHTDFLSSEIVTLNRLQIELRERPLEFSEKQELYTIATTAKDEFQRLGAFLLLDEQEEARKIFDTLEEDRLNLFKGFPIYKFYKYAEEKGTDGQTENANSEQG